MVYFKSVIITFDCYSLYKWFVIRQLRDLNQLLFY